MKIEIDTNEALLSYLTTCGLKVGDSIQTLCTELFEQGHTLGEKTVMIRVATMLIAGSYLSNPAMFARTLRERSPYPVTQSFMADGFLIIRGGISRKALTFRARVREALEKGDSYTAQRAHVPHSYRRRPSILSNTLTRELGQGVCNESKGKDRIKWSLKD